MTGKPYFRSASRELTSLIARVRGSMLISGSIVSMTVRVTGMTIGFGSHVLLSRVLGASAYGSYVIALGWAMILAVVARLGLDNVALRFATNYREEGRVGDFRGFKQFSLFSILAISGAIAVLGYAAKALGLPWLAGVSFPMLAWTALLMAALAFIGWYGALMRTAHKIFLGQAYEQLLRPVLLVVAIGVMLLAGFRLTAPGAMALTFVSALVALVGIALHSRRYFAEMRGEKVRYVERRAWLSMGWVLLMLAICQEAMNQLEIILLGLMASATDAAHFSAAARLGSLVPFGMVAIVTVSAPMIVSAHRRSDVSQLAHIAKVTARFSVAFAIIVSAVLALSGKWALSTFGPTFIEAYPALLILLVGGLVNAFTGAVGYYLLMTGKQAAALKIIASSLLVSAALNIFLIPSYGIVGSAIASAVAVSFWNLLMLIYVRRVLGIDASALGLKPKRPR